MNARSRVSRPQTVVHLLGSASLRGTAQARIVAALARSLDPDRYRLRVWFLDGPGPLMERLAAAGVPARAVLFRGRMDLAGAVRFAGALRAERPRLVHLHVGGRSRLWLLRWFSPGRCVAHVHGDRAEDGTPLRLESLARSVRAVIATSQAVAAAVPGSATVVYPGVDVVEAVDPPAPEPPTVGALGRLAPIKGLAFLLEAAELLRRRLPDLRIELAGAGNCEPRLKSLAAQLSISDSVHFLGWRDDTDSLLRRWQVLAQPSLHEGLGLSVLEAMAAGRPVVASATGGLPELVEHGRTGFLVPVGAVDGLVDPLGRLLADAGLRARMGDAGWRRVRDRFSVAEMATKTARIYDGLLA
jgi:glycosyltransferase involved in cell wall biosynthesis